MIHLRVQEQQTMRHLNLADVGGTVGGEVAPADVRLLQGHASEVVTCAFNPKRPGILATG